MKNKPNNTHVPYTSLREFHDEKITFAHVHVTLTLLLFSIPSSHRATGSLYDEENKKSDIGGLYLFTFQVQPLISILSIHKYDWSFNMK